MSNVTVQFIQRWSSYNCGECAGFPQSDAQSLINRGFAVVKPMPAPVQKERQENKPIPVPPVQDIAKDKGHQEDSQPTENQGPESTEDPQSTEKSEEPEKTSDSDKKNKKK